MTLERPPRFTFDRVQAVEFSVSFTVLLGLNLLLPSFPLRLLGLFGPRDAHLLGHGEGNVSPCAGTHPNYVGGGEVERSPWVTS